MKYLVILPTMVESVADPCVNSLAPEVKENLLIIDNTPEGFAHKYGITYEHYPVNNGVARSWNLGAKRVVEQKLDYLIILSAAIVFKKGMLDFLAKIANCHEPTALYGVESQFSFHLIAIGRQTFKEVGFFDENFYPAYYEETDFIRRMELAHISHVVGSGPHLPVVDVAAIRQGVALSIKKGGLHVDFLALQSYFKSKWKEVAEYDNQQQRDAMYKHPFDDPAKPLSYWPEYSIDELKRKYRLP